MAVEEGGGRREEVEEVGIWESLSLKQREQTPGDWWCLGCFLQRASCLKRPITLLLCLGLKEGFDRFNIFEGFIVFGKEGKLGDI